MSASALELVDAAARARRDCRGCAAPPAETTDRPVVHRAAAGCRRLAGRNLPARVRRPHVQARSRGAICCWAWSCWSPPGRCIYADRDAVFLDQLALAIRSPASSRVAWGDRQGRLRSGLPIAATLLVLQFFVLLVMPNNTARTLAALFATIAWVYTSASCCGRVPVTRCFFDERRALRSAAARRMDCAAGLVLTLAAAARRLRRG